MLAITTRYHFNTGRISASVEGRRVYVDANDAPAGKPDSMTLDEWRHWHAAQAFIERKLSVRDRKLIGGWTDCSTMVWCFADSPAQMDHSG